MTTRAPALIVNDWIREGVLAADDPDERLIAVLTERGLTDPSFRDDALRALHAERHATTTGEPF